MRIAFGIVSLFPSGGLQRDCIEIAELIKELGHEVVIHACRIEKGFELEHIPVVLLPNNAFSNHKRQYEFARDLLSETQGKFDLTVGFDKLLGLDIAYCADASVAYRTLRQPLLKLFPRYRTFCSLEGDTFSPKKTATILLLSQNQLGEYRRAWSTQYGRMTLLPPTLAESRRNPQYRTDGVRQEFRTRLGLTENDWVWLCIGVQPFTKGMDRTIKALAAFPQAKLLICGLTEKDNASSLVVKQIRRLDCASRITWLGHREDIPQLMSAADILVHPARYDTTGTVILEAIVNGLPVIATTSCGYSSHVQAAGAGVVLAEPLDTQLLVTALSQAQDEKTRSAWSSAGIEYGENASLYEGRPRAARLIVDHAHHKIMATHARHAEPAQERQDIVD